MDSPFKYVPLTAEQLPVLMLLLSKEFPGAVTLREQVLWSTASSYEDGMSFAIHVDPAAPPAVVDREIPVEARYDNDEFRKILELRPRTETSGALIDIWLHVLDGYLSEVEFIPNLPIELFSVVPEIRDYRVRVR
jgi:hypothetical protein